jgi:hypothetical protein
VTDEIPTNILAVELQERQTVALESIASSLTTFLGLIQGVSPAEMKRRAQEHKKARANARKKNGGGRK